MKSKINEITPTKKVKLMMVGEMKSFSSDVVEEVRKAIAATSYRFSSQYNGSVLIIERTA